jgi:hypothetical protein
MESPESGSTASDRIKPETVEPSPTAAFQYAFEQLADARDYIRFYLRTRAELFWLAVRNFMFIGVLTATAVFLVAALVVTAIVLFCRGVAEGLTIVFGGHAWLGDLVTGVVLLLVVGLAIFGTIVAISRSWKKRTFVAFAEKKRQDRMVAEDMKTDERSKH